MHVVRCGRTFCEHTSFTLCLAITVLNARSDTSGSSFAVPLTASAGQSNPFNCRLECLNDHKGNYQRLVHNQWQ